MYILNQQCSPLIFRTRDLPEERSSASWPKRLPEAVISTNITNITHINNSNNITISNYTNSFIDNRKETKNVTKHSTMSRKEHKLKTVQEYFDARSKTQKMTKKNNVTSNRANLITKIMESLRNLTSTEPTLMRGNDSLPYCEPYDNLGKEFILRLLGHDSTNGGDRKTSITVCSDAMPTDLFVGLRNFGVVAYRSSNLWILVHFIQILCTPLF